MSMQALCCLVLFSAAHAGAPAFLFAADKPSGTLHIEVDTSEAPDLAAWGAKAKQVVELWYPKISAFLKTDGFSPPTEVKILFKKDQKLVAGTSGRELKTIAISADWVRKHPEDIGMVVHELVHVIQCYPEPKPGWLVEGIADYIRFAHFEPRTPVRINARRANYKDGYKTAAAFLLWIERKYDKNIVVQLNRAMRNSEYSDALFDKYTGKSLDTLWREFASALPK
jgi:hypothetical protein